LISSIRQEVVYKQSAFLAKAKSIFTYTILLVHAIFQLVIFTLKIIDIQTELLYIRIERKQSLILKSNKVWR